MLDEKLQSKIELLQEQIDNIEKSGFYTDLGGEILLAPLRFELALIKDSLSFEFLTLSELIELDTRISHAILMRENTTPTEKLTKEASKAIDKFLSPIRPLSIPKSLTINHQEA
jgi:hypothetical protein